MHLRDLLTGGDRRSLARAEEALAIARQDPRAVDELAALTADPDGLVAYRACDVLEKLVQDEPEAMLRHRLLFVERMASDMWETRLQCVRAVGRFLWPSDEVAGVLEALRPRLDDSQIFVRAWALDSFAALAPPELRAEVDARIDAFLQSRSKALQARARAVARRLG